MRLGKREYKADRRTAAIGDFISPTIVVPSRYDFDKGRSRFPFKMWGNDEWGDCVVAGRTNHMLRFERLEQRRTLPFTDEIVIEEYKRLCQEQFGAAPQEAGDENDQGLVVLDALKSWRTNGWKLKFTKVRGIDVYTIAAFGELHPNDAQQLRQAIYLFHGAQFGFWLPRAVQGKSEWVYNGETGPEWEPGSWGGHLVYSKAYNPEGIEMISWGEKIMVNDKFIAKYCDEAWAVVDSIDYWKKRPEFDINALLEYLKSIGVKVA